MKEEYWEIEIHEDKREQNDKIIVETEQNKTKNNATSRGGKHPRY